MIEKKKPKVKIKRLFKVTKARGRANFNGRELESHEKKTIKLLVDYGFDVEVIIPSNIPGSRNPDILLFGTFWEMKGPRSTNENTIKTKFHKAIKQSGGRAIFDLREIKGGANAAKEILMELFMNTRGMRRIIIIESDENVLDISK